MLQGHAGTLVGEKRRRIAVVVLLINVCFITVGALWRHASGGAPASALQEAVGQQTDAPAVELPASIDNSLPVPPSPASAGGLANNAVMEELRKVIRDPDNGIEIPRLDETSPLSLKAAVAPAGDWDVRLERRIATINSLSAAAMSLVREARSLSDAGQNAEAAVVMQRAAELRAMIASLASWGDAKPYQGH